MSEKRVKLTLPEFKARFVEALVEAWGEGAREAAEIDAPLWYERYANDDWPLSDCVDAAPGDWEEVDHV